MHSPAYLAICAVTLGGMLLFGTPPWSSMVVVAALAIAVLGVPHGGLDHWTGRRLLESRWANRWWLVFFPTYLLVGACFAIGWYLLPTLTVFSFFLISAWHFGREDQHASSQHVQSCQNPRSIDHLLAASIGGLVIWIPAIFRPQEMESLLGYIIPMDSGVAAANVVRSTQLVALCLVPIALWVIVRRVLITPDDLGNWVPLATIAIAIYLPILVSFSIYFCGWHSWQGLQRLRREETLTTGQFIRCVAPLSVVAIVGVAAVGWFMQQISSTLLVHPQTSIVLQTLFIGLSAIAVPHLFLHEFDLSVARSHLKEHVTQ